MLRRASAALVLIVASLFFVPAGAGRQGPADLASLLDLYAGGHFDEAVQRAAQADEEAGRQLRRRWEVLGRQWIEADPARRPRRVLAAAAFALETEHIRAERGDWRIAGDPPCAAACVLDWAQLRLIERGPPDEAERTWFLAAAALAGSVRDWRYLQRRVEPGRAGRVLPGLMERALLRFPGDPALRLEQALAAASRFDVTVDGGRLAQTFAVVPAVPGIRGRSIVPVRPDDTAAGMLAALVDDPIVGAEARMRLGYLDWTFGRDEAASDALTKAAQHATDADVRYLAQFLRGWIAIARGDSAAAIPPLEAALAARPASQSASLALAALQLQLGDAGRAHDLARASLDQPGTAVDPWRMFLYGHYPRWPALVAELRRRVTP